MATSLRSTSSTIGSLHGASHFRNSEIARSSARPDFSLVLLIGVAPLLEELLPTRCYPDRHLGTTTFPGSPLSEAFKHVCASSRGNPPISPILNSKEPDTANCCAIHSVGLTSSRHPQMYQGALGPTLKRRSRIETPCSKGGWR